MRSKQHPRLSVAFPHSHGSIDEWRAAADAVLAEAAAEIERADELRERVHTARLQAEDARFRLQNLREDAILRSVEVQVQACSGIRDQLEQIDGLVKTRGKETLTGIMESAECNQTMQLTTQSIASRTKRPGDEQVRDNAEMLLRDEYREAVARATAIHDVHHAREQDLDRLLQKRQELLMDDQAAQALLRKSRLLSIGGAGVSQEQMRSIGASSAPGKFTPRKTFKSAGGSILGNHTGSWGATSRPSVVGSDLYVISQDGVPTPRKLENTPRMPVVVSDPVPGPRPPSIESAGTGTPLGILTDAPYAGDGN
jgi:hypothetical protein